MRSLHDDSKTLFILWIACVRLGAKRTLSLVLFCTVFSSPLSFGGESIVVRNGHHRAIAAIVKLKKSQLPPETVVGVFEGKPVTAKQLLEWYESGKLLAYNFSHSPSQVEEILGAYDAEKTTAASPTNPEGGIIFTRKQVGEKLGPFQKMREFGSPYAEPNCESLIYLLNSRP